LEVVYRRPTIPPEPGAPTVRGFFVCAHTSRGREHIVSPPFATEAEAVADLRRLGGWPSARRA
jgi:hypothetical protein